MDIGQYINKDPKKYFITFGNGLFKNRSKTLFDEATSTGWFDGVIIESPDTIQHFMNLHTNQFSKGRGFGYWIWKPYIILRQLMQMNDGDYLFYIDAGSRILSHKKERFNDYVGLLDTQSVWASGTTSYKVNQFTKKSLLRRLGMLGYSDLCNCLQVESGFIAIKKTKEGITFIQEWLNLCLEDNYKYITDELFEEQDSCFIEHRHDQSILDCLIKINGFRWLNSDCYGEGPFFHSRMTDKGPREFAPDWWRGEPDYDPSVHLLLPDYRKSKKNPNWWKLQNDEESNIAKSEEEYLNLKWEYWANGHIAAGDNVDWLK